METVRFANNTIPAFDVTYDGKLILIYGKFELIKGVAPYKTVVALWHAKFILPYGYLIIIHVKASNSFIIIMVIDIDVEWVEPSYLKQWASV